MSGVNGDVHDQEPQPLGVSEEEEEVPVSSVTGLPLNRTVFAHLQSTNYEDNEKGMHFVRKLLAVLVLTYGTLLVIVSPFFLVESFQRSIKPFSLFLSIAAFAGVSASIYLMLTKGHDQKFARIALFTIIPSVAVGLGIKFSGFSWSVYVLVALGQATTSFALLHALAQFDSKNLKWLNYKWVILMFLVVSGLWILVMMEAGKEWFVAVPVGLGGWAYAIKIVMSARNTFFHREPDDFIRATITVLGPPIPGRCIPKQPYQFSKECSSFIEEPQTKASYGGVDGVV